MNSQQNMPKENLIIRQPRSILWTGILITLVWGFIIVLMAFFQNAPTELWILVLFGLFSLQGLWYLLITITWKVIVEEHEIRFRNSFGQTKMIPFKTIEKVKLRKDPRNADRTIQAVLYSKDGKKIFSLTPAYVGSTAFLNQLEKRAIRFE